MEKFSEAIAKNIKVGDGFVKGVNLGPMINKAGLEKVLISLPFHSLNSEYIKSIIFYLSKYPCGNTNFQVNRLVKDAVDKGAKVVRGGKFLNETFFEPTVLTGINRNMQIFTEEIFGPVAAFQKFKTEEEVLELANETQMGLAGK